MRSSALDGIEGDDASCLTIALDLLEHCGDAYKHAPEHIKRQFNQALFAKTLIVSDDEAPGGMSLTAEYQAPFDSPITRYTSLPNRGPRGTWQNRRNQKGRDLSVPTLSDKFEQLTSGGAWGV